MSASDSSSLRLAVFGGGEHPTTQLCLELIEDSVEPGMRVCDVGTGTGILSAAAKSLGASHVYACDLKLEAARMARPHATTWVGSASAAADDAFDLVIANIHLAALRELPPDLARLSPRAILSGVLTEQIDELKPYITLDQVLEKEGWCAGKGRWR